MGLPELNGQLVRLRPIGEHDRDRIIELRNHDVIARWWQRDDLHVEFTSDLADDQLHQFVIELPPAHVVGMIQFSELQDDDYRHASIDVFVDPTVHRQGIASDAITTLCNFLFDVRGHHRLVIDPAADNRAAIGCYRKVGFTTVGVMRAYERQSDGTWADGLLMEMLITDRPTT